MSFVLDFLATYGTWEPIISIGSEYLVSLLLLIHLYYILMKLEHLSDIIWIIIDIFFVFDTLFGQFWPFLASYKNIESNISIVKKWIFSIFIVTYQLVLHTGEIRAPQWHYLDHYWWFCVFDPFFCQFFGLLWDLRTKYFYNKWIFSIFIVTDPLVLHTGEIRNIIWTTMNT